MLKRTRRKIEELERENRRLEQELDSALSRLNDYKNMMEASDIGENGAKEAIRKAIARKCESIGNAKNYCYGLNGEIMSGDHTAIQDLKDLIRQYERFADACIAEVLPNE